MTFQLGTIAKIQTPAIKTVFQFSSKIKVKNDLDETFLSVVKVTLKWLKQTGKVPRIIPAAAENGCGFCIDEVPGQDIDCQSIPEKHLWALRFVHPDAPFKNHPAVPGRSWQTDVCLSVENGEIYFGLKLICSSQSYANTDVSYSRPRVIQDLASSFDFYDQLPIDAKSWILTDKSEADRLISLLLTKSRKLPVVAVSEPASLDLNVLSQRLFGYAHVVGIPQSLTFHITEKLGRFWSVFDGGIRTYMPDLNLQQDSPLSHPLLTKIRIATIAQGNIGSVGTTVNQLLFDKLATFAATRRYDWGPCNFITDIKMKSAEFAKQRLQAESKIDKELEQIYELELANWKNKFQESEKQSLEYLQKTLEFTDAVEYYKSEGHKLRAKIDSLQALLNAKSSNKTSKEISQPKDYNELPDWVNENFAGNLVLHSRAERFLGKARYADINLVCNALALLANEYRDMRRNLCSEAEFANKLTSLGLKCERSITEIRAGEEGDTYYVRYPSGSSAKKLLNMHLKKGADREPRNCLRIYFFWDEETSQVVVGALPGHLDTRDT